MEVSTINPNGMFSVISQQGALFSFQLLAILGLALVCKTLYTRNVKQGDDNAKALVDSTLAINNNTLALTALTREIERTNNVR